MHFFRFHRFRKLQLLFIASRGRTLVTVLRSRSTILFAEQQQCRQAELDDFFRLVDKSLMPDTDTPSEGPMHHPSRRLVTVLEAYDHELDRLRQTVRANDEAVGLVSFADRMICSRRHRLDLRRFVRANENLSTTKMWPLDGE